MSRKQTNHLKKVQVSRGRDFVYNLISIAFPVWSHKNISMQLINFLLNYKQLDNFFIYTCPS